MEKRFDVIVIGGGHAGVEAAWAAAAILGPHSRIALVTLDPAKIGVMSCNPAIGGLAKGQLVREVDAMGGLMGLATDATGIQFKVLNRSRGPAVHGPRAQCDKHAYARRVQAMLATRPQIEIVAGSVESLRVSDGVIHGVTVVQSQGERVGEVISLSSRAVVLTTGTFMRGLMHTGERQTPGGRHGEAAAVGISGALSALGFELGRLKTGTPPRLKRSTIRWDELKPALGDDVPTPFSDVTGRSTTPHSLPTTAMPSLTRFPVLPQVDCRETETSAATHELIRANIHRAPMYSGQIGSAGPRYCPSIEDKVVRFADRESHTVFLEPESLEDDWIYCNGISTSLPADVQDGIVRSLPGCESAHIYRHGYAVEYDMVRPHQIHATGMTKLVHGLFLAGQINGTSGYEEAAAQGLVAGINAARLTRGLDELTLGRDAAYIGVLMDDLVTKTPVEPYRMFTSRAEHRLLLRSDTAGERLTPIAESLGLLGDALGRRRLSVFAERREQLGELRRLVRSTNLDGKRLTEHCRRPEFGEADLAHALRGAFPTLSLDDNLVATVHADEKYEPYVVRERAEVKRQAELEHRRVPTDLSDESFASLRPEARQALRRFRPATFGQASRLEGITPADLTLLSVIVRRESRR